MNFLVEAVKYIDGNGSIPVTHHPSDFLLTILTLQTMGEKLNKLDESLESKLSDIFEMNWKPEWIDSIDPFMYTLVLPKLVIPRAMNRKIALLIRHWIKMDIGSEDDDISEEDKMATVSSMVYDLRRSEDSIKELVKHLEAPLSTKTGLQCFLRSNPEVSKIKESEHHAELMKLTKDINHIDQMYYAIDDLFFSGIDMVVD